MSFAAFRYGASTTLSVTPTIAIEASAGGSHGCASGAGRAMPIKDTLIAATALTHDLVVATRNRADFEKAGVDVVDPFSRA